MSHTAKRVAFPEAFKPKKLSQVTDKEQRRFMVDDASRSLERLSELKREIKDMEANDPELFTAAKAKIDQKVIDLKAAKKT